MQIGMRRQALASAGIHEIRPVQGRKFHLTIRPANAAFVAADLRMPAHIDQAAHSAGILDHDRGIVLDCILMHDVG